MLKKLIRRVKKYDLFCEILEDMSFGFSATFSILISILLGALLGTIFYNYVNIIVATMLILTFLSFVYLQFMESYKSKIKSIYHELCGLKSLGLNSNSDYEDLFMGFGIENKTVINDMKVLLTIKIEDEAKFYYNHSETMDLYQYCNIEIFSEYGEIYNNSCYIRITKDMINDKSLLITEVIKDNIDRIKESIENKKNCLNKLEEIDGIMKWID